MEALCVEMSGQIDQALQEKLERDGPWFLTADGATSKGQSLITVDIMNCNDECYHLALVDGGHQKLDAAWMKEQLRRQVDRIPALAGLSQDTARTCKKAFRELHRDLLRGDPAKWRRLSYVDCGEHVSQLLAKDLASSILWLQENGTEAFCCS